MRVVLLFVVFLASRLLLRPLSQFPVEGVSWFAGFSSCRLHARRCVCRDFYQDSRLGFGCHGFMGQMAFWVHNQVLEAE